MAAVLSSSIALKPVVASVRPAASRRGAVPPLRMAMSPVASSTSFIAGSASLRAAVRIAAPKKDAMNATVTTAALTAPPAKAGYAIAAALMIGGLAMLLATGAFVGAVTTLDPNATSTVVTFMTRGAGAATLAASGVACGLVKSFEHISAKGMVIGAVAGIVNIVTSKAVLTPAGFFSMLLLKIFIAVYYGWTLFALKPAK